MKARLLALLVCASPVTAQELVFSTSGLRACLAGGGAETCIGMAAEACMENTPGGYSTVAMGGCLSYEHRFWDDRLNAVYQRALPRARAADADNGGFGASQAETLRDMQRAWIPFRDATCDFEYSQWGGGTGGGPAMSECLMRETAKQTLYLESYAGRL